MAKVDSGVHSGAGRLGGSTRADRFTRGPRRGRWEQGLTDALLGFRMIPWPRLPRRSRRGALDGVLRDQLRTGLDGRRHDWRRVRANISKRPRRMVRGTHDLVRKQTFIRPEAAHRE